MKRYSKRSAILLSLVTMLLISGCSGSDGKDGTTTVINEDKSPPVIISTFPVNGAPAIATNTAFNITFSEAIDTSDLDDSILSLSGPEGDVSGTLTLKINSITFTPEDSLDIKQTYTLTLKSGVKDLAGNVLSTETIWSFTTADVPDNTPPSVLTVTPADGENEVGVETIVTITFDEPMDPTTLNSASIKLSDDTTTLSGNVESSSISAVFIPRSPLRKGMTYSASVTTDAHDMAGNALPSDYSWSFMVQKEIDTTPPTVVVTDPQNGQELSNVTPYISAYFSEEMNTTTLNTETFTLENRWGKVNTAVSYAANKAMLEITQPRLDLRSRYTATVTDFVKDSSGIRMTNDYQWEFITLDGSWQENRKLFTTSSVPQVTINSNGDAIIVGCYNMHILAEHYDVASDSWHYVELDHTNRATFNPQIAQNDHGDAIAIWEEDTGNSSYRFSIAANHYDASSDSWQSDGTLLEDDDTGDAYAPQVAIDASGNAIAVWYQYDGAHFSIYSNRFDAVSGNWQSNATLLENNDSGDAFLPQIVMDTNGNAIAIWEQFDGSHHNIYTNHFNVITGNWQGTTLIDSASGSAYSPQIAIDSTGNAIAVWRQFDGTDHSIYSNHFDTTSGNWQGVTSIEGAAGDAYSPQIAIDPDGNAIAVWRQFDGTYFNIMANYFDAASNTWQTDAVLLEHNSGDTDHPQITLDTNGNAIAIWQQSDGTYVNIWANRYDAITGNWQTDATLIEEENKGDASLPMIDVDATGNAITVWKQSDGVYDKIIVTHFR